MIYLSEKLSLTSADYVTNKDHTVAIFLELCDNINTSAWEPEQLHALVANENLAQYLDALQNSVDNPVQLIVSPDDLVKILAFFCSSVFVNPDPLFVKKLIVLDQLWMSLCTDKFSIKMIHEIIGLSDNKNETEIDRYIKEGMLIEPKLKCLTQIRLEYLFGAYCNGTLPLQQQEYMQDKMLDCVSNIVWQGDQFETFEPTYLTLAHNKGMNLDDFSLEELDNHMHKYCKIFNVGIEGCLEYFEAVSAQDNLDFMQQANQDYQCQAFPIEFIDLYSDFYVNKKKFVLDHVLTGHLNSKYYIATSTSAPFRINPCLWYSIAGAHADKEYLKNFELNV